MLTKDIVRVGMFLLKYLPCKVVDPICINLAKMKYGNSSKYGIRRPKGGPFLIKAKTGRSPTIDVGCMNRIKKGEIKVQKFYIVTRNPSQFISRKRFGFRLPG